LAGLFGRTRHWLSTFKAVNSLHSIMPRMTRGVTASNAAASRIVSKCRGPRSFSFGFTHPKLSNASAMTILSVAARLLAKAAVLPFSRVGQSLTIPAKAHRRRDPSGEHAVPHDAPKFLSRHIAPIRQRKHPTLQPDLINPQRSEGHHCLTR
jgi:hypothetical protein